MVELQEFRRVLETLGIFTLIKNLPVHYFLVRHLYNPLLKRGISKSGANMLVFFISALGHEYLVSGSLGIVEWWAFWAMMMNSPIIIIQKKIEKTFGLKNSQLGNALFWISFCFIGQPLCLFIYYYRYMTK